MMIEKEVMYKVHQEASSAIYMHDYYYKVSDGLTNIHSLFFKSYIEESLKDE